jgi:putative salt-induced outer membrane protein YdiY
MRNTFVVTALFAGLIACQTVLAQAPAAPTPLYTGSFGGGLAITGGNTDTTNFNLAFSLVRDPKTKNVFKADALYLRGSDREVVNLDRAAIKGRDEYSLSKRVYLFGEMGYLRDKFKDIDYALAPIGGIGYKLIVTDNTLLDVSGGAGGFFEKNSGVPLKKSGSVNAGQIFTQKLSATATLTESLATWWKTNDFGDSLTNFRIGGRRPFTRSSNSKSSFSIVTKLNRPIQASRRTTPHS